MKKVGNHKSISKIITLSLAFVLSISLSSFAQNAPAATGDAVAGKALFNANCAACHKLDAKMTGPALRGIAEKRNRAWLGKWIKDSKSLIASGDADAVKVFEENNKIPMAGFPQLSDADVDNIIAYTSEAKPVEEAAKLPDAKESAGNEGVTNEMILGLLVFVLAALVTMLLLVNNVLRKIAKANNVEVAKTDKFAIWKAFVKNQFLVLVSVVLFMLVSLYFVYGYMMQIGVDKDYAPIQPIHFSHKIHAGDNGLDCKYCHSSARVSKNAGIPSLNVCMNCHKNIAEFQGDKDSTYAKSKEFYTEEIQKLYDAVGWDKTAQKYTGKTSPVKWVRIHNLQDFVYFNHSQHVTVAGIECQKCHGPVQTFEIQKQFAPLTMGWCIECHRTTDIKVEGNDYYKKIHDELSKKYGVSKLTAAQMGGLECGKCHY
ncbi:MAG: Alternative complex protein [Bacteroidota bacterium]|jgi:mono/diheme cytochrome c family protein/predicted HAD superfamily Cof-like phosphohydrolase